MRWNNFIIAFTLALGSAGPLHAQVVGVPAQQEAGQASTMTEGEVRRLDNAAGKVTIKHGPIKNLDMPPMTMVFTARDKAQLANLKVGDKIQFTAVYEGGQYIVTELRAMK